MKLDKIIPYAELLSSVAVVITLIYLTIQTQQTNDALLANSRQTALMADLTLIGMLVGNPEVMDNMAKPVTTLNFAEREQMDTAFAGLLRSREFAWLQFQRGVLDAATFDSYLETLLRWIQEREGARHSWERFSPGINADFREYINAKLELP